MVTDERDKFVLCVCVVCVVFFKRVKNTMVLQSDFYKFWCFFINVPASAMVADGIEINLCCVSVLFASCF